MPHTGIQTHYLHELPLEEEERLAKLFTKLDADGNGNIDITELSVALKEFGVPHRYAEVRHLFLLFSPSSFICFKPRRCYFQTWPPF